MTVIHYPPRVSLGQYPTPIEKLDRLSRHLGGPDIYVKRDDQTGLATGGNKTRKLEFLLAEAQAQHCDHVITLGGPQSNHCRQTAAAAARLGMGCSVVLRGEPTGQKLGNLLLDELLGAKVQWAGNRSREDVGEDLMIALRTTGHRPYLVPLGGSTPLGAIGYVVAMEEALAQLTAQDVDIDAMVVASSSAGTQAGLVLGGALGGYTGDILGVSIDATVVDLTHRVIDIVLRSAKLLGSHQQAEAALSTIPLSVDYFRVEVNADYLGDGYAVVGDRERDAIRTVARTEGLLLDPVYTGRAMGGLFDLISKGRFDKHQRVLFWHTGGSAAISAFANDLRED